MKLFGSLFEIRRADGTKLDPLPRIELELMKDAADGSLKITAAATDIPEINSALTFDVELADPLSQDFPATAIDLSEVITLRIADPGMRARFADAVGGLRIGLATDLRDVRITLRPKNADGVWSLAAPFLTIELCWDLATTIRSGSTLASGVQLGANAQATFPVCTSLIFVSPPERFLGIPDLFALIDIEPFSLSTGWIPIDLIEDRVDLLDMRGLAAWLLGLWDVDLSGYDLDFPDWDIDFPGLPKLPFDARFQEHELSVSKAGDVWHIFCRLKGLEITLAGFEIAHPDFELSLRIENSVYVVSAGLAELQYPHPDRPDQIAPQRLGLPFDLLNAEVACWMLRVGLHVTGGAGQPDRLCVDTILEIGDFKLATDFADDPLWTTDIRLHLRDLTIMTAEYSANPPLLFERAKPVPDGATDVFAAFKHPLPAMSVAEDLPRTTPDKVNETGLTLLGADFRGRERVYIAWEQRGNQLFKALAHDLLGSEAAGAIPTDADMLRVGLEVAIDDSPGERSTQVRLDWANQNAAMPDLSDRPTAPPSTPTTDDCVPASALLSGVHLPFGAAGVDLDNLTVPNPMTLRVPGITLQVAQPAAHSLVFREEAEGFRTVSYLLIWDDTLAAPKVPFALASAQIGFSLSGSEDTARQVAEVDEETADTPFLTVAIGAATNKAQALRVLGVRQQDGSFQTPKFLKVYAPPGGTSLPSLIPTQAPQPGIDDCPPPPAPLPPLVPLGFDDFSSPDIFDPSSPWRLSLMLGAQDALLKLFGGNDAGKAGFTIDKLCRADDGVLEIHTKLDFEPVENFKLSGTIVFGFDVEDLSLSIRDGAGLALKYDIASGPPPAWARTLGLQGKTTDYDYVDDGPEIFGLAVKAIRRRATAESGPADTDMTLLKADIRDGKFSLSVPDDTELLLRFDDIGDDGLNFRVREFFLGPGGLDCEAEMLPTTLKMPGLKKPFALDFARLVVENNVLKTIRVDGSGQMPDLFNAAPISIGFSITQDPNTRRIRLSDFTCELGGGKAPILSKGVRLRFDLKTVRLEYEDRDGIRPASLQFFVTGSLTFVPEGGEFGGSLLENFKDMTLEFTDAPVSDEFLDHIELMVTLNEPVEREVFSLFRMQLRSVGFHPNFEFEPGQFSPALIFGGQIEFADTGDVASVEIDFHRIYLGFPADGETLPQVHAKGLRVEISSGGFKIGGRVDEFKDDTITGFKGEGVVQIPGLPELSAAFAFTRIRRDTTESWKRAWFVAVEAARISYQIAPLPLYLRQIGLGFGYRYTSPLIRTFETEDDLATLIEKMLEAINAHQTLARIDSWIEDPEGDGRTPRWSIGFETVFSLASANSDPFTYNAKPERKLKSAVAQILAFLRSDLTFVAATKVWFPISADDFFENRDGMRQRPLASGFMAFSAPKQRLLIHAASGKNPYLGPDNDPVPKQLKPVFNRVHFEATFLSEPGLVHAELGWPDRLMFPVNFGALTLTCRGGVLFRLERDVLIQGVYFSATARLSFSGGLNAGVVGVCITAEANFSAAVRLMVALYLSRPLQSQIYAALGVDISVKFSLRAWLHIKFRFFTLRLSISFSFELQIVVALELGWSGGTQFGFKAQARVVVGVFGRSLSVRVAASLFGRNVDRARDRLMPYMSSFLEPGAIPPIPGLEPDRQPLALENGTEVLTASLDADRQPVRVRETALDALEGGVPSFDRTERARERMASLFDDAIAEPALAILEDGQDDPTPVPRLFNVALVESPEALSTGQSKRRWYGWIMPNLNTGNFFPVPKAEGAFARLTLPTLDADTTVYTIGADGNWTTDGGETRTLYFRFGPSVEADEDNPKDPSETYSMNLRDMLASSHVPKDPDNDKDLPFSFGKGFPLYCPIPLQFSAEDTVTDTRLTDPVSDVRNPKRKLDPENRYDRLVLAAMEKTPDNGFWDERTNADDALGTNGMTDQALGNQSFLMSTFLEDVKAIANWPGSPAGRPADTALPPDRPTVVDLGLLICVEADTCPDWLCTRPDHDGMAADIPRPRIAFVDDDQTATSHDILNPVKETPYPYDAAIVLWPAIDFATADFQTNSPQLDDIVSYFDDDSLNVGWTFTWPGDAPAADLPGGAIYDPEDMLDHYDIAVFVTGSSEPVKRVQAVPGDLVASEGGTDTRRVKARYQFNQMLQDMPELRAVSLARRASVFVNVTPIAQTGKPGDTRVIEIVHNMSTAPLPADDATLDLAFDSDGILAGHLSWRVLSPPTEPGVAPASRWELVIRPLVTLPLGGYPADAVETGEAGLMNLGAGALRDGDIIIALNRDDLASTRPVRKRDDPRDPALEVLSLDLTEARPTIEDIRPIGRFFDHRGQACPIPDSATDLPSLLTQALSFFGKEAPEDGGGGWRLYLRAHARPFDRDQPERVLPQTGYSGLMPVTMRMVDAAFPKETHEDAARESPPETPRRLLDHLEWARQTHVPIILPSNALREDHGPLNRPYFPIATANGDTPSLDWSAPINVDHMDYAEGRDGDRGVTLAWKGIVDDRPYAATSSFELFEARLDHMLAQDIEGSAAQTDPHPDFNVEWRQIRAIAPVDRDVMGTAVTAFTKPETWWTRTAADTAQVAWDTARKALIASKADPLAAVHPADDVPATRWWSWSESELAWPGTGAAEEAALLALSSDSEDAPIEAIKKIADLEQPTARHNATYLAACRDLGEYLCGTRLHPYLLMLVGQLAAQGAPSRQSGLTTGETLARYEVNAQIAMAAGEAAPEPGETEDPLEWLNAIPEAADPCGWRILAELGLSVTLSLRDGLSRMTLTQDRVRDEIAKAISALHKRLQSATTAETDLADGDTPIDLSTLARLADHHLGMTVPIHPSYAVTAQDGSRDLDDASLSMVQVLLRPQPHQGPADRRVVYEFVALGKIHEEDIFERTPYVSMELLFPDQQGLRLDLEDGVPIDLAPYLRPGEVILARYLAPGDSARRALADMLDGVNRDADREARLAGRDTLPPAFTTLQEASIYSPFGQFNADPQRVLYPANPNDGDPPGAFDSLVQHLNVRFRPKNAEQATESDDTLSDARQDEYDTSLSEALQDETKVRGLMQITARFFKTGIAQTDDLAPRPTASEAPFHPLRVTLAAPEEQDPQQLSPDRQGWFSYTHLIKEDWATLRGYAVRALPRDWLLNPESREPARLPFSADTGMIDVKLDRIRRVEPPKPLGTRLVGSDAYQLQEVILSEPIERSLSRAGRPFAHKLEFLDFRYSPKQEFRFDAWQTLLQDKGKIGAPTDHRIDLIGDPLATKSDNLPVPESDDTTLLAEVPAARFGATIIRFTAEPFYYNQHIDLQVRAGAKTSPTTSLSLSRARPTPLVPFDADRGHEPPVEINRGVASAWADLDGTAKPLPGRLDGMKARWDAAVAALGDAITDAITAEAAPLTDAYTIRQPQLAESLPPDARDGHFAAEVAKDGRGFLPDPGVQIELTEEAAGARKSVSMITPSLDVTANDCFVLTQASNTHAFSRLRVAPSDDGWDKGVLLSTQVTSEPIATPIDLSGLNASVFNVPETIVSSVKIEPEDKELQLNGRLAHWTPLAVRLASSTTGGALLGPLPKPRWAIFPLANPTDIAPPAREDVSSAFRVLLNRHHRFVLDRAALSVAADPSPFPVDDLERQFLIYNADLVVVTPRTEAEVAGIMNLHNPHSGVYKLYVYKPNVLTSPPDYWFEVTTDQSAGQIAAKKPVPDVPPGNGNNDPIITEPLDDRIVVVVPKLADVTDDAMSDLLATLALLKQEYPDDYPFDSTSGNAAQDFASLARLRALTETLAPELLAQRAPAPLKVYAHQGNMGAVEWPASIVDDTGEETVE